ncbi:hypothetical protein N658DRAFT_125399 [Parathielavia hyrcaniae]|uniref:Uncharacterized protein n=1 Tax=Parathielavia hyrcaniae TaxID=113614 RepID=A0AAN6QC87_9PEZI|nr:hypothetical protein N658DRAFT_125399 [Parathielavia hyrcaniae]
MVPHVTLTQSAPFCLPPLSSCAWTPVLAPMPYVARWPLRIRTWIVSSCSTATHHIRTIKRPVPPAITTSCDLAPVDCAPSKAVPTFRGPDKPSFALSSGRHRVMQS